MILLIHAKNINTSLVHVHFCLVFVSMLFVCGTNASFLLDGIKKYLICVCLAYPYLTEWARLNTGISCNGLTSKNGNPDSFHSADVKTTRVPLRHYKQAFSAEYMKCPTKVKGKTLKNRIQKHRCNV